MSCVIVNVIKFIFNFLNTFKCIQLEIIWQSFIDNKQNPLKFREWFYLIQMVINA